MPEMLLSIGVVQQVLADYYTQLLTQNFDLKKIVKVENVYERYIHMSLAIRTKSKAT